MTVLTMRYLRGHFVVTGPDIEPLKFKSRRPLARHGIRTSAYQNRNLPRLSARGAGLELAHLELKARRIDA